MAKKKITSKKIPSDKKKDAPDDSIQLSKFSEKAKDLLWQYSSQIRDAFDEAGLSDTEVEEAANEIVDHVIRLSIFHAGMDELVLTDHVNVGISKLGDASTIRDVLDTDTGSETQKAIRKPTEKRFVFTAYHLVGVFWLLSWFLTGSLIFMGFGYEEFRWIGSILFVLAIIVFLSVRSTNFYQKNTFIKTNIRLNLHILLFPLVFEVISIFFLDSSPIIMDPVIITAWLMILSTKEVRDGAKKYVNSLRENLTRD